MAAQVQRKKDFVPVENAILLKYKNPILKAYLWEKCDSSKGSVSGDNKLSNV